MHFDERIDLKTARPAKGASTGFAVSHGLFRSALALLAVVTAFTPHRGAAAESAAGSPAASAESATTIEAGPQGLKRQVRVMVESQAPPEQPAADPDATKAAAFKWKSLWAGWDGLHLELVSDTRLADPWAEVRARIAGTNQAPVFHLESLKMSGKLGFKYAVDGAAFVPGEEFSDFNGGVELRRARLYAKGDCLILLPVSYQLEIGYIPHEFYLEESYLAFPGIPGVGEVRGGQYQAPMGLDVVTSSRDITFMEPAAPLQALAPGVNAGLQMGRPVLDQRATWRLGIFTDGVGQDFGDATTDYGRAILRLTGLPIHQVKVDEPDASQFLHLGLSANILYSASSSVRYRSRPESHLAPYVVDTGDLQADGAVVVGGEVAWVKGPFSVQGEYLHAWVRELNGQVPDFTGVYATLSWFLTGESRPYDLAEGMFGRVIPRRNFEWGGGGWGAWEVAARYSCVNLDSADVEGGRLSMVMLGVNWYLHPHVKWRFNYGFGQVSGGNPEGHLSLFETRVEMDF